MHAISYPLGRCQSPREICKSFARRGRQADFVHVKSTSLDPPRQAEASVQRLAFPSGIAQVEPR